MKKSTKCVRVSRSRARVRIEMCSQTNFLSHAICTKGKSVARLFLHSFILQLSFAHRLRSSEHSQRHDIESLIRSPINRIRSRVTLLNSPASWMAQDGVGRDGGSAEGERKTGKCASLERSVRCSCTRTRACARAHSRRGVARRAVPFTSVTRKGQRC